MTHNRSAILPALLVLAASLAAAQSPDCGDAPWRAADDQAYAMRFGIHHGRLDPAESLATYLERRNYDRFNGATLDSRLDLVAQPGAGAGWSPTIGVDTWSVSLNEMYRASGDPLYLLENLRLVRVVMANRDDRRAPREVLWNDAVVPLWGDGNYSSRGREAYVLHTGLIVYPILDFLRIAAGVPQVMAALEPGEYGRILADAIEALDWHDGEWTAGPAPGEGSYRHPPDYEDPDWAGVTVPFNWLSAAGRAQWAAFELTGEERHRERAVQMARYIRNRLQVTVDGAYLWQYYLPADPVPSAAAAWDEVNSEDTNHAALSVTFPILMADAGQVFDEADMMRFARTVTCGVGRLGDGVLLGEVNGDPTRFGPERVSVVAELLRLTPYAPQVFDVIADYYTGFIDSEGALDGALLRRFRPGAGVTAVAGSEAVPAAFELAPPHPNPFNASVQIGYRLAASATVRLQVYDLSGQRLETLVDARQIAGAHRLTWRAEDVASGVYLLRLQADGQAQTRKLLLLR